MVELCGESGDSHVSPARVFVARTLAGKCVRKNRGRFFESVVGFRFQFDSDLDYLVACTCIGCAATGFRLPQRGAEHASHN